MGAPQVEIFALAAAAAGVHSKDQEKQEEQDQQDRHNQDQQNKINKTVTSHMHQWALKAERYHSHAAVPFALLGGSEQSP